MPLEIKLTDKQSEILLDRPEECICECWLDSGVCAWMNQEELKIYPEIMTMRFCDVYHTVVNMIKNKLIVISAEMPHYQLIEWIIRDMVDSSTWDRYGDKAEKELSQMKKYLSESGLYCVDIIEWCDSVQERKDK